MHAQPQTEAASGLTVGQPYVNVLSVTPQRGKIEVVVRFPDGAVHTGELPGFAESLAESLPSILSTRCHHGYGGLFAGELPHTETGHVLEHAILAFLDRDGFRCRAITEWNWRREPWGTFHIAFFGKQIGLSETLKALQPAVAVVESAIAESVQKLSTFAGFDSPTANQYQLTPGIRQGGEDDSE
ncbi:MAG: cyanophycin synthetase family protein [Chloroflexota bacterium]